MAGVTVRITNEVGVATHRVQLPHDTPVGTLLKVLPGRLGRPLVHEDGSPIGYRIYLNNTELNQDETLSHANVRDNDTLSLRAQATAGGGIPCAGGPLILEVEPLPPQIFADGAVGPPRVFCDSVAMEQMKGHVARFNCIEAGGLLLGSAECVADNVYLMIEASLPAEAVLSGPGHLTFTQETWRLLECRRLSEHPQALVLGWYHSHPGLGLFLSRDDRFLHRQVFGQEPWSVALVIDPLARKRAFFWPKGPEILQCTELCPEVSPPSAFAGGGSACPI